MNLKKEIINKYYSVQFSIKNLDSFHQFILWDISPNGLCILIEKDSGVLDHLAVNDVFMMKYYPRELLGDSRFIRTGIRHISNDNRGRMKEYYMVGLAVLD